MKGPWFPFLLKFATGSLDLVYTPCKRSLRGVYRNHPVCPSVCPSVRLSVCPSVRFRFRAITSVNICGFHSNLVDLLYIGIPWMGLFLVVVGPWPWPPVTLKYLKFTFSQISPKPREIEFIFVLYTYRKSYMNFHLVLWPLTWGQGQRSKVLFWHTSCKLWEIRTSFVLY